MVSALVIFLPCVESSDEDSSNAHLCQMWVSPEYRGSGVGSALIDQVQSWASERNIAKSELSVSTTNI